MEAQLVILTPEDPLGWWKSEHRSRPLTGLIFERGAWCQYCRYDVRQWREQLPQLESLGGTLYIVTAQDQESIEQSANDWGLNHLVIVSDPDNVLAHEFGLVVSTTAIRPGAQHHYDAYKNGVCQPGYVIVNQAGTEIASWRQQPTAHNIGGALDRPIPSKVVNYVQGVVQDDFQSDVKDPNEVLDGFAQVVEAMFDELPEDIRELLREEKRLPSDSSACLCERCEWSKSK